jgi:hypothetical protein
MMRCPAADIAELSADPINPEEPETRIFMVKPPEKLSPEGRHKSVLESIQLYGTPG